MLYPTYAWSLGEPEASILVVFPFLLIVFGFGSYIWFHEVPGGLELNAWRGSVLAAMVILLPSPVIFLVLLIHAGIVGGSGGGMAATVFIHIFFPILFIGLVLYFIVRVQEDEIPELTLGKFFGLLAMTIYAFVGVWQSFLLGTTLLVMGFCAYTVDLACSGKFNYVEVSSV